MHAIITKKLAEIELIVCITEGVPVLDMLQVKNKLSNSNAPRKYVIHILCFYRKNQI